MRAVLALLLGLISIAIADTDDSGEAFSWDSSDTDQDQSYNGLVVQVYNPTDGDPVVTLGTDLDNHEATYCLTLSRVFEATGYDFTATPSEYTEIDGTSVDLKDADCTVTETSSTTFTIACSNVDGASLTFAFTFVEKSDGDEGLEYTISLDGYTLSQDDAQLVLIQSVTECSDLYAYSADSGSESEEDEESEEPASTEAELPTPDLSTTGQVRRLLSDDENTEEPSTDESDEETDDEESDSADEESGISSDDSDEYDSGYAQFIVNGQAYDKCDGVDDVPIDSDLVYDKDAKELAIIFAHFDCNLFIDPYVGVDGSKLMSDSGANGIYVMISAFIGLIGALLY